MISISFYSLTYVGFGKGYYKFWYDLSYIGITSTFLILIFQIVQKVGVNISLILQDDNFHYLVVSVLFLILRPYVFLPLVPFFIYSVFHVLAYVNGYILPILSIDTKQISTILTNFINNNNYKSVQVGSLIELYSLGWLFLRLITIRKRSLMPFIIYFVFIKVRFEKNIFTRNYVKSFEIQIDKIINQLELPILKNSWIQFKQILKPLGNVYLVNDYTKEKVN